MKKLFFILTLVLGVSLFNSCSKDAFEPTLADQADTQLRTVDDVQMLLAGSYNLMSDYRYYGRNMIISGEVRADNVFANGNSGRFVQMAQMNLTAGTGDVADMMQYIYGTAGNANIIINNTSELTGDQALLQHYIGEAYAIRALVHFDLLRLWGQQHVSGQGGLNSLGVTYVKEFRGSLNKSRGTVAENKADIYNDIETALTLMSTAYNDSSKFTLTTHAVNALKARVAIYFKDYSIAKTACEAVIGNFSVASSSGFAATWTASTPPANSIFELNQTATDNNGINSLYYIYNATSYGDIQVLSQFISNAEFQAGDVRSSTAMINTVGGKLRNVGKYKTSNYTNPIKVFRYEEVVLNYAEAIMDTNPTLALTYLNSIPQNRNGSTYAVANIDNILKERRKEFAFEGFRFDDLARNGRNIPLIDPVYQTHGGPSYGDYKYSFPLPNRELDNNLSSVQNFGYDE